jgi:ketosteroid isomerase-like protein
MRKLLMLFLLPLSALSASAQGTRGAAPDSELYRTIAALDAQVFDAYNRCDLEKLGTYFAEDLEFYHDQSGLSRTRQTMIGDVKKYICGKVTRELVPGTLEVHPMKGFGAMEMGVHRFHHPGHDDTEPVGEAQFIMLWENKDGAWRITRVISYDHRALPK